MSSWRPRASFDVWRGKRNDKVPSIDQTPHKMPKPRKLLAVQIEELPSDQSERDANALILGC
jgi:hypothetical protein